MAQNLEYDIIDNELIVKNTNELWKNQKNMIYSIADMPFYIHFAVLDEEFISAGTENNNKLSVPLVLNGKDLRIKNITWYDENHSNFSAETKLTIDNDGVLFKSLTVNISSHTINFGNSGVLYTDKTAYDINFGIPVTPVRGLISIFKVNTVYKVYLLEKIDGTNSIWIELKLPAQDEFWLDATWNGKLNEFTNTYSFDAVKAENLYNAIYKNVKTTPVNVQWSIYSYDVDSNNQLRNFLIDEDECPYFKNKYTNDEPITMCIAVPVDDVLIEDSASIAKYKVSSSKTSYILFDYSSTVDNAYPLYSPELFEKYGIGFIKTDWLFYDESGNLRVKFSPNNASNLLFDDLGVPVENSLNDTVIGCIKSWKTHKGFLETSNGDKTANKYEYLLGTAVGVEKMLANRAYVGQSFKMFSSSLLTNQTLPDNAEILTDPIHIQFNVDNKPQTVCKAEWSLQYSSMNKGSVVEKKDNQLIFRITDINQNAFGFNSAEEIKNLGIWIYNENYGYNQLYYFDTSTNDITYEKIATQIPGAGNQYSYHKALSTTTLNLIPYVDENGNEILQYERWKYVIQSVYTDENPVQNFVINPNIGIKKNYIGVNRIYTKIEKYSPADEDAEELLDSLTKDAGWVTPNEFYTKNVNTSNVDTGSLGYTRANSTIDPIKNNWFWIDEIKNWCIWLRTSDTYLNLYVWNGRNGWDKFEDIMNVWMKNDLQTLKRVYCYNPDVFTLGPSSVSFSTYCSREEFRSPSWMAENVWLSIILKRDTNMSTYDTDSFQNIHTASILYNNQQGVVIPGERTWRTKDHIGELKTDYGSVVLPTVGCPCVIRNTNGQLNLMYKFKTDGNFGLGDNNTTDLYYQDEGITYLNSVCKIYFGNGDEKTIKDWKRFNLTDNSEEQVDRIYTGAEESLYGVPPVPNSTADTINMKMSMTAPRPNVSTKSLTNDDYILRWNR